ncbi:hypothetical protein [Bacillus sp. FSL R12-0069]|uniref:hypothetical protein n=1 Tax=Bacillus sp. FSL R12-0069 TaxID=2975342 RepID=UPI0030F96F67
MKITEKSAGIFTEFKLPYKNFYMSSTSNGLLYLPVNDKSSSGMPNKLVAYNLSSEEEKTVFDSQLRAPNIQGVQSNKDWLMWIDTNEFGTESILYAENISNKKKNVIYKTNQIIDPFLYENYISWLDIDSEKNIAHVIVYDLKTNTKKVIAELESFNSYSSTLHMNNGKLVYSNSSNGKTSIYVYELESGKISIYPIPHHNIMKLRIVGNKIFYTSFINPENPLPETYFILDMQTKSVFPIFENDIKGTLENSIGLVSAVKDYMVFQTTDQEVWIFKLEDKGYHKLALSTSNIFKVSMSENGDIHLICDNFHSTLNNNTQFIKLLPHKIMEQIVQKKEIESYNVPGI